jgi:hypothetical protein
MKQLYCLIVFILSSINFSGCGGSSNPSPSLENASFMPTTMNLSIATITTTNAAPIVSEDNYVTGHIHINNNGTGSANDYDGDMEIKGHGNSTWGMPKKPYHMKLNSKGAILGMPSDKDWIFLANYDDKSLMRDYIASEFGNRFGLPWSPRSQFCEVFLNGQYEGVYELAEQVKIAKNRVNITSLATTDTSSNVVSGGYLLEIDQRQDEDTFFTTNLGVDVGLDDPDPIVSQQLNYIEGYIQQTENAIYASNFTDPTAGYANYIDTTSFINWYLVNELFKNNDAIFFSSVYMYKDRNSKLFMGPVWDFDIGAGNINYNGNDNPQGWWIRNSPWFNQLFNDPAFQAKVVAQWNAVKATQIDTIGSFIDVEASALTVGANNNFQRWTILNNYVWPNAVVTGSYQGEINYLKSWLAQRAAWMDSQYNP